MTARSTVVIVHDGRRDPGLLHWPLVSSRTSPDADAVVRHARDVDGDLWLGGGEATLRVDLPDLIAAVRAATARGVGLETDGLVFAKAGIAAHLRSCGLTRVRVGLHSARSEAHDWLVGRSGALRRLRRAIRVAVDAGIEVTVRCVVTRPTMDRLSETVAFASRVGASAIELARLRASGPAAQHFVMLSPRLGLCEPHLEAAATRARADGLRVRLLDFPRCAAPRVEQDLFGVERVVFPMGSAPRGGDSILGCAEHLACGDCPRQLPCMGAPLDYVATFGETEFASERHPNTSEVVDPRIPEGRLANAPPPRGGRSPSTRLRSVARAVEREGLGGDPLAGRAPRSPPAVAEIDFAGSTKAIRQRMVRAAQEAPDELLIRGDGVLDHPEAVSLVRDALRLSIERVRVVGDFAPLTGLSDRAIVGMRGLTEVVALNVAERQDAEIASLLERIERLAGVVVERR